MTVFGEVYMRDIVERCRIESEYVLDMPMNALRSSAGPLVNLAKLSNAP